jgi:hypothetical protein
MDGESIGTMLQEQEFAGLRVDRSESDVIREWGEVAQGAGDLVFGDSLLGW